MKVSSLPSFLLDYLKWWFFKVKNTFIKKHAVTLEIKILLKINFLVLYLCLVYDKTVIENMKDLTMNRKKYNNIQTKICFKSSK